MTIIIISLLLLASLLPHLTFTAHENVGIVNGRKAIPHSRPYMVSIQTCGQHNCGGFLISDQYVLTAAHCWTRCELLTVVVGAHDLRKSKSSDHIRVKSSILHPNYNPSTFENDIMLLKLEKKVRIKKNVKPISLPKKEEDIKAGTPCAVAGWGLLRANGQKTSNYLMEADTTVLNQAECEKKWEDEYFAPQMICVYGRGGTCNGDSGGPLVCGETAVGVTSFGEEHRCNSPDGPNVYTNITAYISWINNVIGNGRSGFQCSSKKEEDCRAVSSDVPCRFAVSGHWSDRASKESVATLGPPQKAWGQGQATQPKSLWGNTDLRTVIITKKASKRS
ncbi:Granzyme M [Anabarilius grahami]|uniref:Granzyme M n=1 Tax=Anabarilius grahami TaxID=495550 RepID=A0A3N0YPK4_ANAGA|nr:Granzyme M [Anabarilius grahami]